MDRFGLFLLVLAACHSSVTSPDARRAIDASSALTCAGTTPVLVASGTGSSALCTETIGLDIGCGSDAAPGMCSIALGDGSGAMQTLQQSLDCGDNLLVFSVPVVCDDTFLVLSVTGSDFTATCSD